MAKITGPLHSLSASGAIAQSIIMLHTGAKTHAQGWHKPGGAASPAQAAHRALYRAAADAWRALSAAERQKYVDEAIPKRITGFNLWMSRALTGQVPVSGTQWDAGTTTWDAGNTTWDA